MTNKPDKRTMQHRAHVERTRSMKDPARKASTNPADIITKYIAAHIRDARIQLDIPVTDVARHIRVSVQQYYSYETGNTRLSATTLYEIACFFQEDIAKFFPTIK